MVKLEFKKSSVSINGDYYQILFDNISDGDNEPFFLVQYTFEFPSKQHYFESDNELLTGHYIVNSVVIRPCSFEIRYGYNDKFIVLIEYQSTKVEQINLIKASKEMFKNVTIKN